MKEDTIHLAFRSKETGRYLFHMKYPADKFKVVEDAANELNMPVEDFILDAIKRYLDANRISK